MGAIQCVFQRYEKKYMVNQKQYEQLMQLLQPYMCLDEYGKHTICNIYYDTDQFELIRTSLEKPPYKEKLRLRSYGSATSEKPVFLELKKKVQGVVYKRRVCMPYEEVMTYLDGSYTKPKSQILKEIDYVLARYGVVPKVVIAYDRMAYYQREDSDVRITFDFAIRYRDHDLDLRLGDHGTHLTTDEVLMEVKVPQALPLWLVAILDQCKIYPASFSKYGTCYSEYLHEQLVLEDRVKTSSKQKQPFVQQPRELVYR